MMAQAMSPYAAASAAVLAIRALRHYPPFLPWCCALAGRRFDWHIAHA
jgi:hypothetical protein